MGRGRSEKICWCTSLECTGMERDHLLESGPTSHFFSRV